MAEVKVIDGGEGLPPEPNWRQHFNRRVDRERASEDWGLIVRELQETETLSVSSGHMVQRLVIHRILYDRAMADVLRNGIHSTDVKSGRKKKNENWNVSRTLEGSILALEKDLGLCPARKSTRAKKFDYRDRSRRGAAKNNRYLNPN